jgi:hypothetical protein
MFCILSVLPVDNAAQNPEISLEPPHFLDPTHTAPDEELVVTLKISNIGDEILNISDIGLIDVGDGTDWIILGAYDAAIAAGAFTILLITLNAGTILSAGPDPAGYDAIIRISHDAPSAVDDVGIHLTVASDFNLPEEGILNTTCKQLKVYNTGRLGGGNDGYSLNIPGDCDSVDTPPNALMYLNNASPVIAWNDGSQNLVYTTLFSQEFTEDGTFRPQSDLNFSYGLDPMGAGTYDMMVCTLSSSDSLFGVAVTLYAPTDGINCFIFGQYSFFNWNPIEGANDVYLGLIADWDIPSDIGVDNGCGYYEEIATIWQYGADYDTLEQDNDTICVIPIIETDRIGGVAVLLSPLTNAWTDENDPHLTGSGFDRDYIYNQMSTLGGYNLYTDSTVDIHSGITFEGVDFSTKATYEYRVVFATTNRGVGDYVSQVGNAGSWMYQQGLNPSCCHCWPGDANADGDINVGDAVYLIGYIFKGGPDPRYYGICGGDANGDCSCDIGDAVFVISYVFKNGSPPPECLDWVDVCGWY